MAAYDTITFCRREAAEVEENMSLAIISAKKIIKYTKLEYEPLVKSQRNLIIWRYRIIDKEQEEKEMEELRTNQDF